LLYESYNSNNAEFIAALDPKIAEKLLDKLIWLGYQENKPVRDIVTALRNRKARHYITDALSTMLRLLGEELEEASWLIQARSKKEPVELYNKDW